VVSLVEPRSGERPFGRLRVALSDVEGRERVSESEGAKPLG